MKCKISTQVILCHVEGLYERQLHVLYFVVFFEPADKLTGLRETFGSLTVQKTLYFFKLIKIKIFAFFSVDHIDIFDHKYCIDPGNSFSILYSKLKYKYLT